MVEQRLKHTVPLAKLAIFASFCMFVATVEAGSKPVAALNKIGGEKVKNAVVGNKTVVAGNKTIGFDEFFTQNEDGILTCSGLVCPRGTDKCSVYQSTKRKPSILETSVKCFDDKHLLLDSRNGSKANPNGTVLNDYLETSLNGNVWSCRSCVGSTPEEIVENRKKEKKP